MLHRWRFPLRRLWPDLAASPGAARLEYFRRVHLLPGGDLLAIYEGQGLVKLDRQSRVLWAHRGGIHHDLAVTGTGEIWALDREGRVVPRINPDAAILEDLVARFDRHGNLERRFSLLTAFERSPYAALLAALGKEGDVFHTNALELLDGRAAALHPAFRKGNLLLSIRQLSALAVVDPSSETVVWAATGPFRRQHEPSLLADGRLLLFDNQGAGRDVARVVELDPADGRILWAYGGASPEVLSSPTLGTCQRLPNGNTLITESENGRALEVTRDGEVVWELNNPHRAGDHGELVAVLFEVLRLPADFPFRG